MTSSAPYVSPLSLDYTPPVTREKEVPIDVEDRKERDKVNQSTPPSGLLKHPSGRSFKINPKMKKEEQIQCLQAQLESAEQATLEEDEKTLAECDQALSA